MANEQRPAGENNPNRPGNREPVEGSRDSGGGTGNRPGQNPPGGREQQQGNRPGGQQQPGRDNAERGKKREGGAA